MHGVLLLRTRRVEKTGFEPAVVCLQGRCITRLCYFPKVDLPGFEPGTFTMPWCCSTVGATGPSVREYVHSIPLPSFPERHRPEGKYELVLDALGRGP